MWDKFIGYVARAFTDHGEPSSSRLLSGWLSVSSMALIWYIVRHMFDLPVNKLLALVGALPYIIGALATFVVAPYGVNAVTNIFQKQPNKDKEKDQ